MDDSGTVQWRRDAATSRPIRALWALGVGTFLAAIVLIVLFRFYPAVAGRRLELGPLEVEVSAVIIALLAALAATVLALALAGRAASTLATVAGSLPGVDPEPETFERLDDVLAGAAVMGAVIFVMGQFVSGSLGNAVAALTVPLAFGAIVLAAFLRSSGALDPEGRTLYLLDPDEQIDLETVRRVRVRTIGDDALVSISYDQSDGVYVEGPRHILLPANVARELERLVNDG